MTGRRAFLWPVLVLAVAACSGGAATTSGQPTTTTEGNQATTTVVTQATATSDQSSTMPTAPAASGGGCRVEVTGDEPVSWDGPDDAGAVTTDYWYTEAELREQHDFLAVEDTPPFEEMMANGDQIFTLLLMNCPGESGQLVSLFLSDVTTRADFPFGPGTYPIPGGSGFPSDFPPATFLVLYSPNDEEVWGSDGEGSLQITRWDPGRITGTFSFAASERLVDAPRSVQVAGSFDFTCKLSQSCG